MSSVPWVWRSSCRPDERYVSASRDPVEGLGDGMGVDGLARGVGEHDAGSSVPVAW
jgi:hypothetical protein